MPSSNHWEKCLLHKPIGSPEKSVGNYHYSLCNDPEERSSHLLRVRKLDSRFKGADILKIPVSYNYLGSRDISVEIASRYGLKGPGIESRWGEIFRTYPDWLRGPPSLLYNGYRVFPRGYSDLGVMLTTHPFPVPRLRKSWAIAPLTLWVLLDLLLGFLNLLTITELGVVMSK